jgi:hypothetical protein
MTDRRQIEIASDLRAQAQSEFSAAAGAITARYRERREALILAHHDKFTKLRDHRASLLGIRPRTQLVAEDLAATEDAMRAHHKAGLAPIEAEVMALEAQRRAEIEALDKTLRFKLADIEKRVRRGLLEDRMEWSAPEQKFVIPKTQGPAHA